MTGDSARPSVRGLAAGISLVAAALAVSMSLSAVMWGVPAGAQTQPAGVDVTIEAGVAGLVTNAHQVPVRLTVTSVQSRTVTVELTNEVHTQRFRVELNAETPTLIDTSVQQPALRLSATVRSSSGTKLDTATERYEPDDQLVLVGIGRSIAGRDDPWDIDTVAGIQRARLAPLVADALDRPGYLESMSGLVLGPADVERLTDSQRTRIHRWVALGGNLALDQEPTDPLPIVGAAASPGSRTAVEMGWVRFSGGAGTRGDWASVVEPATVVDEGSAQFNPGDFGGGFENVDFGFDSQLESAALITAEYLPTGAIGLILAVTLLAAGPGLWLVLRTRRARRWMWLAAPAVSIVVAMILLVAGQSTLTQASGLILGQATATGAGTIGEVAIGLTSGDSEIELGPEAHLWASQPRAAMVGSGAERRVTQEIGTNSFGLVALGPLPLDDGPAIEVEAVATSENTAKVSVTNNTDGTFDGVLLTGFSRARGFVDVGPRSTETLEFAADEQIAAFGPVFSNNTGADCFDQFCNWGSSFFGRSRHTSYAAHGRVAVSGLLQTELELSGVRRSAELVVTARAAVLPSSDDPTAGVDAFLRVESVGRPVDRDVNAPPVDQGFDQFGNPIFEAPAVDEFGNPIAQGDPQDVYLRVSSPVELADLECEVQTAFDSLQRWDGSGWTPIETVGDKYESSHFELTPEVQRHRLGPLPAGEPVFVKVRVQAPFQAANALLCGVSP